MLGTLSPRVYWFAQLSRARVAVLVWTLVLLAAEPAVVPRDAVKHLVELGTARQVRAIFRYFVIVRTGRQLISAAFEVERSRTHAVASSATP
jgi:hypothetical protein